MGRTKLPLYKELELLQRQSFDYFRHEVNLANGLIRDKTADADNWPASIAATGLALSSYPVAVERDFMLRDQAVERTLATLRFFWNSPQGTEPDATGYKGFYYHFLDMETGRRAWQCELSTIDTTFLIAGILTVATYFDGNNPKEAEIRRLGDQLYQRVDWQWAQNQGDTIALGWTPEQGFSTYRWEGYDEALLLYILGLGSPTFPLPERSYTAWTKTYQWKNIYGYEYLHEGSLFTHQLSHIWIDFRMIQDAYMREKNLNYFRNSQIATYVQQQYAIQNPHNFVGYGPYCWGITACDGPGPCTVTIDGVERQFFDYVARSMPDGPDDGTVAPWVAVTSLPFAPDIVLPMIEYCIYDLKLKEHNRYGFRSSFNRTYQQENGKFWISPWYYGIDQGPIILMVENTASQLIWMLMRSCPYIITGLRRAGFTGGYLKK